jgi:excisionase family DNA binding protein
LVKVAAKDWLSVAQAAARLQVSPRRVRQLLAAGELAGEDFGGRELLDAAQVERRAGRRPPPGRPYSPSLAWMLLALLSDPESPKLSGADRSTRHRLRRLLAQLSDPQGPSVEELESLLRRRARTHRYWIHPGLVAQVFTDPRVSAGRARAAAAYGLDVNPGEDALGYVAATDLADVEAEYALEPDLDGPLELRAYEPQLSETTPSGGMPVPVAAAVFDLLESDDVRLQRIARNWLDRALPGATAAHGTGS